MSDPVQGIAEWAPFAARLAIRLAGMAQAGQVRAGTPFWQTAVDQLLLHAIDTDVKARVWSWRGQLPCTTAADPKLYIRFWLSSADQMCAVSVRTLFTLQCLLRSINLLLPNILQSGPESQ